MTPTLTDYLSGKSIPATPEEKNRQSYLRLLHEDYGYPKELMETEFPVKRRPSDRKRSVPVDIAVFESAEDRKARKPKIFVETKRANLAEGEDQLEDYLAFEKHTSFGVWFNGEESTGQNTVYFRKSFVDGEARFDEITNIPRFGFADISEEIPRRDLKPTNNLISIFKSMRGYIAANNVGVGRDSAILEQLIMVIIAKLFDERYVDTEFAKFRVVKGDHAKNDGAKTKLVINELFHSAKERWTKIFDDTDRITLDDQTLIHVVSQLQNYSLTDSPRNVVSQAFESIISYATKGSQGQFFTPKNVVDLMVAIANPTEKTSVFDPALGTAGFLASAMFHVWNSIAERPNLSQKSRDELAKGFAEEKLFGIEKDAFLAKVAKAYMAVLGDGRSGIFVGDSLSTANWSHDLKAAIERKKFNIILTNPPFGKDVKLESNTKKKFEFGNAIELAFLERSLEMLEDDGLLGIILPETTFHAPSKAKVREKLFYPHNITHLIDLPHDTFRPYNNAKCDIIFLRKNQPQQPEVTVIKVLEMGHNHLGAEKYRFDQSTMSFTNQIADDIPNIINQINSGKPKSQYIRKVKSQSVRSGDLLVARPYFNATANQKGLKTLGPLVEQGVIQAFDGHGSPRSHLKGLGEYPYTRVKDIVNLEIAHNREDDIPEAEYLRLRGKKDMKALRENDIVFVRRGSYRIGDVGIVYEKDLNSVLTREITVFRVLNNNLGITAFNLLGLLNSKDTRDQIYGLVMVDTTLPNLGDRWKQLVIDVGNQEYLKKLDTQVGNIVKLRKSFWNGYSGLFGILG